MNGTKRSIIDVRRRTGRLSRPDPSSTRDTVLVLLAGQPVRMYVPVSLQREKKFLQDGSPEVTWSSDSRAT